MVWSEEIDFQAAYDASASTRAEAFAAWEAEVENSRRIEREAESLYTRGQHGRSKGMRRDFRTVPANG